VLTTQPLAIIGGVAIILVVAIVIALVLLQLWSRPEK